MSELYIGLMSGTSADGVDVALVDLDRSQPRLVATHFAEYAKELRRAIFELCQPGADEIKRMGEMDVLLGKTFAAAVNKLLKENKMAAKDIAAIGSHGHTIRHYPQGTHPFTLQIGDPNIITAETGITTVGDFRRRDIAVGGQGAPLVPAFHQHVFSSSATDTVIVNIGGIANITVLPKDKNLPVIGYDTGPGNTLLDAFIEKHLQQSHDANGAWATQGQMHPELLNKLLNDAYFKRNYPKSTGREYFHLQWLDSYLSSTLQAVDIQTTLVELTAVSIINAVKQHFSRGNIFVCGGGVHNTFLMSRLRALAPGFLVESTQVAGVDPNWVEAMAFAWLAQQTLHKKPGNMTAVTGAKQAVVLGAVYY